MNVSRFKRADSHEAQPDNGYARLLCTEPGCGRKWTVQVDSPKCSFHQWGIVGETYASMVNHIDVTKPKLDGKEWARRILSSHAAGDNVRPYSLNLARQALRVVEAA